MRIKESWRYLRHASLMTTAELCVFLGFTVSMTHGKIPTVIFGRVPKQQRPVHIRSSEQIGFIAIKFQHFAPFLKVLQNAAHWSMYSKQLKTRPPLKK